MKTLLLIDANSLIHRAFHALPPLTSAGGVPTGALYGVSSILLRILRTEPPEYAAALFDRPEPTFRKEQYPAYKATRPKAPDELIQQIVSAHKLFAMFGIAVFEQAGFEADDLIATFAERFASASDLRVVILTGDTDTLQLVRGEQTVVQALRGGIRDTVIYDEPAVKNRYGLPPTALADYKALVGDPSDNVKGVPGIGPKTAARLLQEFGTIDGIIQHVRDEKLKAKFAEYRSGLELARMLILLRRDVPVPQTDLPALRVNTDTKRLGEYFDELNFGTLHRRLTNGVSAATPVASKRERRPKPEQPSMF